MNLTEHLKKPYWERRVMGGAARQSATDTSGRYFYANHTRNPNIQYLTEEDFLNENSPGAHIINEKIKSTRPVFETAGETAKGQTKWQLTDYDDAEVVSLGLQKRINTAKAAHFAKFWVACESKDDKTNEYYNLFNSWRDIVGLDIAFLDVVNSCFSSGDGAIFLYSDGRTIDYKVYSKLYGDNLYPELDENMNLKLYREYNINGKSAIDVISTKYVETWVKYDETDDSDWLDKVKAWFKEKTRTISEDGYRLVRREKNLAGDDLCQAIYFRVPDIPSGIAQQSIESLEKAMSYVSDEVKASAFPILFVASEKITTLPRFAANGKTIAAKGTPDNIKASKVEYISPADASNIASLNINTLRDNILRTTMSVFIEPEILKSGADSSTTIKILFAPEVQWCMAEQVYFHKGLKDMVEVFKRLVALVEDKTYEFSSLRLSVGQEVWLPQNESEKIDNICKMVYAGILSQENARNEYGSQYLNDVELTRKEKEYDLYLKSYMPAKAKAEAEARYGDPVTETIVTETAKSAKSAEDTEVANNPYKPGIDNNNDRKDIADSVTATTTK